MMFQSLDEMIFWGFFMRLTRASRIKQARMRREINGKKNEEEAKMILDQLRKLRAENEELRRCYKWEYQCNHGPMRFEGHIAPHPSW